MCVYCIFSHVSLFAPCYLLRFLPDFSRPWLLCLILSFFLEFFGVGEKKAWCKKTVCLTYLDSRSRSSDRKKSTHDRKSLSPPAGEANWWDTECTSSWLVKMALDPDIPDVPDTEVQILPNEYAHFVMVFLYFLFQIDGAFAGLVTNSILLCWLFTIKDQCKRVRFQQTHNQGLCQLLLTMSWDLRA